MNKFHSCIGIRALAVPGPRMIANQRFLIGMWDRRPSFVKTNFHRCVVVEESEERPNILRISHTSKMKAFCHRLWIGDIHIAKHLFECLVEKSPDSSIDRMVCPNV
jgi:hypothetical protein